MKTSMKTTLLGCLTIMTVCSGRADAGSCGWQLGNLQIGFVPDFDQIRQGLPSDGFAYCVPTAAINWMAWIDGHGNPDAMPFGPMNWQSQSSYNAVSDAIEEMGAYMSTHPTEGTKGAEALDGLAEWFDTHADPDDFLIGRIGIDEDFVPGLDYPWTGVHQGALIMPVIGWYTLDPYLKGVAWFRQGGHVVSLNGLFCNNQDELASGAEMWFRDPADDVYEFDTVTQSQFFTRQHELTQVNGLFSLKKTPQPGQVWPRAQFRVEGYAEYYASFLPGHVAFYEGFIWVKPTGGYSGGLGILGLSTHEPNQLDYITAPPSQSHPAVASIIVQDLMIDPITREHVLLARQSSGANDPIVRAFNQATGEVRTIYNATAPRRMSFDRFGNLYLLDGSQIVRVDRPGAHQGTGAPNAAAVATPAPMDALQCDDVADALYAYSGQANALARYPLSHTDDAAEWAAGAPTIIPIPGDAPSGAVHMTIDPRDGCVWLTGEGSRRIAKYAIDPVAGVATEVDGFEDIDLIGADGLDVSRAGRVFVVRNGAVAEYSKDGAGVWGRSSHTGFAGLAANGIFRLERGRTNMDPDPDDTFNVVPSIPDCILLGDLNNDGAIGAADLAILLGQWGECALCAADLNGDGAVGAADLAIMLGAWGTCAQ